MCLISTNTKIFYLQVCRKRKRTWNYKCKILKTLEFKLKNNGLWWGKLVGKVLIFVCCTNSQHWHECIYFTNYFVLLPFTMLPYNLLRVDNNKLSWFPYNIYDALQVERHVRENQWLYRHQNNFFQALASTLTTITCEYHFISTSDPIP